MSLLRLIFIYKMFFLIESGYIIPVYKDYKTIGTLESVMWIIANLPSAAGAGWTVKTPPICCLPVELIWEKQSWTRG